MWDHTPREGSVAVASSTNRFFMQRAAPRIAGALRRAGQQRFAGGVSSGTNARYFASFARSDVLSRRESHLPPTPSPLVREFHVSPRAETWPVTIGIGIAVGAWGLRYTVEAWNKWRESQPKGAMLAARYYKGPFEDEMSRSEAAKILGVREHSPPDRIRERHRKLLMLNHPDTGGSTFLTSKINDAKALLTKGRD